jgi:tetratricopeptide (TPR) repeat protein
LEKARALLDRALEGGDGAVAERAIEAYLSASRLHPTDPAPLANAALLALDFGDGAKVSELLANIEMVAPGSDHYHFVSGALHLARGEYPEARRDFDVAKKGDFKPAKAADLHCEAVIGHGIVLLDQGSFEQALEVLEEAVALNSTHRMVPRARFHIEQARLGLKAAKEEGED